MRRPARAAWTGRSSIGPDQQPLPEIAAVYKIDGDTFTVCNGGFLGAHPKEFKSGEGVLADVVVFHRLDTKDTRAGSASTPASPADTKDIWTVSMTAPATPAVAQQPSLTVSSNSKEPPATGVEQVRPVLLQPPVRSARRFWLGADENTRC